jgi:hypothetical protein
MMTIVLSGALANKRGNAGGAWERMSWAVGFRRLGLDVWFVEQIAPESCLDRNGQRAALAQSANLEWFRAVAQWFGFEGRAALVCAGSPEECHGASWQELIEIARSARLLVNLSGHLTLAPLLDAFRRKAYVDLDPGFTQFWHVDPATPFTVSGHDLYFTLGENIGRPDCPVPDCGLRWHPTRQPVVLEHWPVVERQGPLRLTTVASWRAPYGPLVHDGKLLGLKVHEFRKFAALPQRARAEFELALDIHPADQKDLDMLRAQGWKIVGPRQVVAGPSEFREYVQQSSAEFSVAQGVYVETRSGWFSDRSTRYLASGKPVLVQDTGLAEHYPVGEGLLTFSTMEEAVAGVESLCRDYDRHCQAARRLAETCFDSDKVLREFIVEAGCSVT